MTQGTQGRIYGGDPKYVHCPDGARVETGLDVAADIDAIVRNIADDHSTRPLCPGCYMVILFNAAIALAGENKQSIRELGQTMASAFQALADNPSAGYSESIEVILDPEDCP